MISQSIKDLFAIYQMPQNILNFNSTCKGSNWSIETGSCEDPLGHQVKQPPI